MTKNSLSCQNSKVNKYLLSQQNSPSVLSINPLICLTKTYFKAHLEEEKPRFKAVQEMLMKQLRVLPLPILSSVQTSLFLAQICNNPNSKLLVLVFSVATASVLIATRLVKMKITILPKLINN